MSQKMPSVDDLKTMSRMGNVYLPFKTLTVVGVVTLVVLSSVAYLLSSSLIESRRAVEVDFVGKRVDVLAQTKANLLHEWVKGVEASALHIAQSDAIRLFVSESSLAKAKGKTKLSKSLQVQKPYFERVLQEIVKNNSMVQALITDVDGSVFMASAPELALTHAQKQSIKAVVGTRSTAVSPLAVVGDDVLMDIILPIEALDDNTRNPEIMGVLFVTAVVTDNLKNLMAESPFTVAGETSSFVQFNDGVYEYVRLNDVKPTIFTIDADMLKQYLAGESNAKFETSVSPVTKEEAYLLASYVPSTPFVVVQEYNAKRALKKVSEFAATIYTVALLVVILVGAVSVIFVSYVIGARNRHRVNHQQQVLNALVKAVEIRDPYLKGHHERVARWALKVANQMRLTVPERSTLYYSAMLSGVGKIFVSRKILAKPGKLTVKETKDLRQHVDHAMAVLKDVEFDFPIADVIEQMYERVDGSGYPESLEGADINLLSRILAVCDVFCALTKPRSYRSAMTIDEALEILEEESSKYDNGVLGVLKTMVEHGEV